MIEGCYIEIDGRDIYYEKSGAGSTLLCLHTAGTDGRIWKEFAQTMSSDFSVLVPDLPGHGKSTPWEDWRSAPVSVSYYADVVEKLIEALDLKQVILVGCSIGAVIALRLSLNKSGRISKSIVVEGAGKTHTFRDEDILSTDQYSIERAFNFVGRKALKENVEKLFWIRTSNNRSVYIADLFAWNSFDMSSELGRIGIPVYLVRGEDDPVVTNDMVEETRKSIPQSEYITAAGLGHYPMIESPKDFASLVRGIITRQGL